MSNYAVSRNRVLQLRKAYCDRRRRVWFNCEAFRIVADSKWGWL